MGALIIASGCSVPAVDRFGKTCDDSTTCGAGLACLGGICVHEGCLVLGAGKPCGPHAGICTAFGVLTCLKDAGVRCQSDSGVEILPTALDGRSTAECFPPLNDCAPCIGASDFGYGIQDDGGYCRFPPDCRSVTHDCGLQSDGGLCAPPLADCVSGGPNCCRTQPTCAASRVSPSLEDGGSCLPPGQLPDCARGVVMPGVCLSLPGCEDFGIIDGGSNLSDGGRCHAQLPTCARGTTVGPLGAACIARPSCADLGLGDFQLTLPDAGFCWATMFPADCPGDGGACRTVPPCVDAGLTDGGRTLADAGSCTWPSCASSGFDFALCAATGCADAGGAYLTVTATCGPVGLGECTNRGHLLCRYDGVVQCLAAPKPKANEVCDGKDNDCDGVVDNAPGCIVSVVGADIPGFADGTLAAARLSGGGFLSLATLNADAGLLVADKGNHAIRFAAFASDRVHTLAGTGVCGFRDGDAGLAQFCEPMEAAWDAVSNGVYITDSRNHRLRFLNLATGRVSTLAGTGAVGTPSLLAPPSPALSTALNRPQGLAVLPDAGVVFAEPDHHLLRIYLKNPDGGEGAIATFAGTPGVTGAPQGLTALGTFNPPGTGQVPQARLAALLRQPTDVSFDPVSSRLHFTDAFQLRWVGADNQVYAEGIRTVDLGGYDAIYDMQTAGSSDRCLALGLCGAAGSPVLIDRPMQLVSWSDHLIFADSLNDRVRAYRRNVDYYSFGLVGNVTPVTAYRHFGLRNGNALIPFMASPSSLTDRPTGLAADVAAQNLYVIDGNHRIRRIAVDNGTTVNNLPSLASDFTGGSGVSAGSDNARLETRLGPLGRLAVGPAGRLAWIEVSLDTALVRWSVDGATVVTLHDTSSSNRAVTDVEFADDGSLYFTEVGSHVVRKVAPSGGSPTVIAGTEGSFGYVDGINPFTAKFRDPSALSWGRESDGGEFLIVADKGNNAVRRVGLPFGPVSTFLDAGVVAGPVSVALTPTHVFVADNAGSSGAVAGFFRSSRAKDVGQAFSIANTPVVSVATFDGGLFASSATSIFRLGPVGGSVQPVRSSLRADWRDGDMGDGGLFNVGQLGEVTDFAVAADGGVYIADRYARRIRIFYR